MSHLRLDQAGIQMRESSGQAIVGSVLVIGGGIAGIQAALDLADSGYYVRLLERSPAIGGTMAQLDKTFPTNDCSMCILSPKVVECARHLNIELMTYAELESVSGTAGRFHVRVRHKPRYIDAERCTGCTQCATVCPIEIPSVFDEGMGTCQAVYRPYPQAVPNTFVIEKRGTPPCKAACPAGTSAQGYIALIARGRYAEALELSRRANPFTSVCGRICYHPCEDVCNRRWLDGQPVAIAALKRFMADWAVEHGDIPVVPVPPTRSERIAIVGGGPAGLTAARDLCQLGYPVTVFEAQPKAGGMLRYGIPDYRLPQEILDAEIKRITDLGVELRTSTPIDDLARLSQAYDAVLISIGAHLSPSLHVEGESLGNVYSAIDFLRAINSGERPHVGRRVVVVGGGNTAIDAARCARRLGAEVKLVYRRTRSEMPAYAFEVAEAEAEGVQIEFLASPVRIFGESGVVSGVELVRMRLGDPDASGRRRPIPIENETWRIEADAVILAIGQRPDSGFLDDDLALNRDGTIAHNPGTLETSRPGVFVAGDVATGPRSAVEAIGMGHRAAEAIHRYLTGEEVHLIDPIRSDQIVFLDQQYLAEQAARGRVSLEERAAPGELSPEVRVRNFEEVCRGLTEEQARAEAQRCLSCGTCSECYRCLDACEANAIDHSQRERIEEFEVGAIIVASGSQEFDPTGIYELGYSRFEDVITSIEFERLLSASGPYAGHVVRPSDGLAPRRIAFLQCVGSRERQCGHDYCSSVCCMYAIKEAVIAKEHSPEVEATIFFMDLRAFGKDFDRYYERARDEYGVRFIRSRVARVERDSSTGELVLWYVTEEDSLRQERFDLVVLSVGLEPGEGTSALAKKLALRVTPEGFVAVSPSTPTRTSREGIFVCGTASGPKDIPETVVEASAAAAEAAALLSPARRTLTRERSYPPERDVFGEPPRIGVFVCHCGINIAGTVDVEQVCDYARTLPYVVYAGRNLFTCSQDTQESLKEIIRQYGINRVVVASCSPRTHEPLFQETLREVGLNPYLFELANIRDQCAWVHMHEPEAATEKAKDLVRMAVSRVVYHHPLQEQLLPVRHSALVLGGGVTGLSAAFSMAEQGFDVHLVEKGSELGGNARHIYTTLGYPDVQRDLQALIAKVCHHPRVTVYTETQIVGLEGYVGNYQSTLEQKTGAGARRFTVQHGVVIVATGASERTTNAYLYGQDPRVLTQRELHEKLARTAWEGDSPRSVVMIQCVESRDAEHPYCSRVCCSQALENALLLKERFPDCEVYVLYRDIRSYGLRERFYGQARDRGVIFVRYDPSTDGAGQGGPPVVRREGEQLCVSVFDPVLQESLELWPDLLALSVGIAPSKDAERLARLLRVPLNQDGFFLEAHMKLRPVEFATEGIYVAGLAHGPKAIQESIVQAQAAVSRACTVLSQETLHASGMLARVDQLCCVACGDCERICPYGAIQIAHREVSRRLWKDCAEVNPALCKACGACAAACRSGCITLEGFDDEQIMAQLSALVYG